MLSPKCRIRNVVKDQLNLRVLVTCKVRWIIDVRHIKVPHTGRGTYYYP